MANKDLINLGISPDSGTGDSARRGGEKINTLFSDIYTQFGDSPVGQDPSQPFYGYRRPFFEYEYKVGELHPAGRFIPVTFKTTNSKVNNYDSEWGYGHDSSGNLVDSNGDGIPDIYRDSEWYFLSRGEAIDADFSEIDSDSQVHFVLPIGAPGDQIIIRDGFGTWNDTHNDKGIHVSFWTTPYEFQTISQVEEWEQAVGLDGTSLDSDTLAIRDPLSGDFFRSNWHKVKTPTAIEAVYPRLDQPFATSRSTDPYDGLSKTYVVNKRRYQFEFLFSNYEEGWIIRQVALDAADVTATLLQFAERLDAVDSDLDRGLYVSTDSDIRHTVPIFRRTSDGREIHGNLSLRGDYDSIMTTIDSEDTELTNDPRSALGGDKVQPLTTTVRFKLRDDVKVKNDLFVGNDLEVGHHLQVGETLTVDSDLAYFNNNVQIHETLTVDSDVYIAGQLVVEESSTFNSDVRFMRNIWVGGDSTNIETETLHVNDNLITINANADGAPLMDTGLIFQRYDQTSGVNTPLVADDTIYNSFLVWDEAEQLFTFGETVSSDSDLALVKDRTFAKLGRGEFRLYDSENTPRVVFEKATGWPDGLRGSGTPDADYPNERLTQEPDFEFNVLANATFGRDSDDVVVFNSRIMSNLIPFGDEKFSLGDSDNKWKDLYLAGNTIYLGSVKIKDVDGQVYFTDSDDNRINLDGASFAADSIVVDSDLVVGGDTTLLGNVLVVQNAQFDSDVEIIGGIEVGREAHFYDDVFMWDNLYCDSDVVIKGNLTVNGTTTYVNTSNLEVADNLIVLNKNQATPFNDTGIIFQRFDSDSASAANWNATFLWDETNQGFTFAQTESTGIQQNPVLNVQYVTIGDAPAATAPFVFDMSGASDPDGLGRPTLTGDGTAVIDGGVF